MDQRLKSFLSKSKWKRDYRNMERCKWSKPQLRIHILSLIKVILVYLVHQFTIRHSFSIPNFSDREHSQMTSDVFDLPTCPNQILYYISLFSKIRCSLTYNVIHISIPPSKELCSKMASGEVDASLP